MGAVMKKLVCMLLVIMGASLAGGAIPRAGAQELGGSFAMTPAGSLSLGLRADWVSQQKMKDTDLKATLSNQGVSFSETGRLVGLKVENDYFVAANAAYGVAEWLNVFAQVGLVNGGTLKMDGAEAKLGSNLFWALGVKARPFENKSGLGLMLTARYMRYDDREVKDWKIGGTGPADKYGYSTDDNAKYWQMDAAAILYWKMGKVTPYIGGAYTYSEMQYDGKWNNSANGATVTYDAKFKPKDEYLALAGVDIMLGYDLVLNLHGAFGGRTEMGIGLNYNF
jgi:hypothetical protein